MRKLIAGNWKMNGLAADIAEARAVAEGLAAAGGDADVMICPPATLIAQLAWALKDGAVAVGGQDCHAEAAGAHTGDVSAEMLADAGAVAVIVGHSERRTDHGETDALVRGKAAAAHRAGLGAIVCVGETEAERLSGRAEEVVARQLQGSVPDGDPARIVIAYEPVWAIGTGRTPTGDDIAAMHAHIHRALRARFGVAADSVRILYGGSMKPANAAEILAIPHVGGGLVGGASLKAKDFLAIIAAAAPL
ncbi:triose-phosphate isomerase [Propylenella binzhouense]|uniref:Triosephosphate isomerase n=1 Tax=Propylenella binzhouense TaxID=2555902 RepID=A0A964T823_9HYPH|nr:triose-phosphate isomerase [Propylenella binzhouense]MYZ50169.1 triose-phosphate isomerase [Propylenella binzhouense]